MAEQHLKTNEHYLNIINVILVEIGSDQNIRMINKKGCQLLGYSEEELIGKNWFECVLPEHSRRELQYIFDQMISGEMDLVEHYENEVLTKSRQTRLISWHNTFLKNENNEIIATLSAGEDITASRSSEQSLKIERDRAQSYLDISEIVIMVIDKNRDISIINRKGCSLFDASEQDLQNKKFERFLPKHRQPDFQAKFIQIANAPLESSFYYEESLQITNKENRLIAWHFKVLKDEKANFNGLLCSGTDITEQRRAEDLLKKQRDLAYKLNALTSASDGYSVFIDLLLNIPGIDQAGLYTYDKTSGKLKLNSLKPSLIAPEAIAFNSRLHDQYFEIIMGGQTLHLYEQILKQQFQDKQDQVKSIVIFPIQFENNLIATLDIASTHISFFSEDMLQAFETLAAQFGNALVQLEARQALQQSEALNRGVLDNLGIGMLLIGTDYRIMISNKQIRKWYPELNDNNHPYCYKIVYDTNHGSSLAACTAAKTFQSGERIETILNITLPNKDHRYFRSVCSPIFNEQTNSIVAVVELIEDITDKRKIDEAMQSMHLRTSQILASIPSILIGIDNKNNISEWNVAAETLFNIPKSKTIGASFFNTPIPWTWPEELKAIRKIFATEDRLFLQNVPYTRADDTEGFLEVTVTRMMGTGKIFSEFLIIANDVTETRVLESNLLQAQKLESIGQLAAGIAHEINTPIQYVGDNIRFLEESFQDFKKLLDQFLLSFHAFKDNRFTPEMMDQLSQAIEKADLDYLMTEFPSAVGQSLEGVGRVATIVRALKGFAHPDDALEMKTININQAIENTTTVARNEWKYVANLETNLDPHLPEIPCYPGEFNQVILNLLVNAAHAIKDANEAKHITKGLIHISTSHTENSAEIRIQDSGLGIPKPIQEKIFNPFFTTKSVGTGTGQGLAISRAVIVDKHHGSLSFETEDNTGTTFIIQLPLEQKKEPATHE